MSEDLRRISDAEKPVLSKEDLAREKAERFAKDPDSFIEAKDLGIAAMFNEDGRIGTLVGQLTIDQLLHLRAVLNDKVQDRLDFIKATYAQKQLEEQQIKMAIAQKPGKMQGFARSLK